MTIGTRALGFVLVLLVAASIGVQVARDRVWEPYTPERALLWVQSSTLARRLALSFDALAADVYWIRAVLYYGGMRLAPEDERNFDALYPLLELTTGLDPRFKVAYRFGAIFLAEPAPDGPGRADQAIALLERGIEADPAGWEYLHDIGFIHYWWTRDYRAAASWFERAADVPGSAEWLRPLAATTLLHGGDRETSRALWRRLYESSEVDWLRNNAQHRLRQIDALDAIDQLQAVVARAEAAIGRRPADWRALIVGGWLRGVPLDPAGAPFVLDPATGRVTVSRESPLWPLPDEPPAKTAAPPVTEARGL
ncbi:MAG: tetratricopeptide repeat protein [Vicinamibacteria bacterium]